MQPFRALSTIDILSLSFFFLLHTTAGLPAKDPYVTLGVTRKASLGEITKAYRMLSLKWHPDKNPKNMSAECNAQFKELGRAYQMLSNPGTRQAYDTRSSRQSEPWIPSTERSSGGYGSRYPIDDFEEPTVEEEEFLDVDPYNVFDSVFGRGLALNHGIAVIYRDGQFFFVPKSVVQGKGGPQVREAVSEHPERYYEEEDIEGESQIESESPSQAISHTNKVEELSGIFPGTDKDLIRDILWNHRGDMQRACDSLLEIQGAHVSAQQPPNHGVIDSEPPQAPAPGPKTWENLTNLQTMFPRMDEDVLYEILMWSKGDVNKAIDTILAMNATTQGSRKSP
ncbi:hypothetical protein AAMO2058_000086000 [Amorphochlora amoebiformis]